MCKIKTNCAAPYLQSLCVSGYVPGHAAEPLAVTVHCSPGAWARGRTGLAIRSAGQDQDQHSHQQPQRSHCGAARANGAQSSHHHCGKWGPMWDPQNSYWKNTRALKNKSPEIPERAHQTLHATGCRPPFRCPPFLDICFWNFLFWIYIWVFLEGCRCVKAVNWEFGSTGQGEGRSSRRWTGSLAALQRRKLPHVPGMRCPISPGVLCPSMQMCMCVEPSQWNTSFLDLIQRNHYLTHTSVHTDTLQVSLSWLLIHNTRPMRKQRRRSVSQKLGRGHGGGEILIPIIYQ